VRVSYFLTYHVFIHEVFLTCHIFINEVYMHGRCVCVQDTTHCLGLRVRVPSFLTYCVFIHEVFLTYHTFIHKVLSSLSILFDLYGVHAT
jgi:hypothetical protein